MKARFKTVLLSALGTLAVFSTATLTSCNEDKCKAIVCAYGGVCREGACTCPAGYEGAQCETVTRNRYLGVWTVTENGTLTTNAQYNVSVEADPSGDVTKLRIKNFRNSFTDPVSVTIRADTMFIPQQTVNNNVIQGRGFLVDDPYLGVHGRLTVRYSVTDGAGNTDDFGLDTGEPSLWNH